MMKKLDDFENEILGDFENEILGDFEKEILGDFEKDKLKSIAPSKTELTKFKAAATATF